MAEGSEAATSTNAQSTQGSQGQGSNGGVSTATHVPSVSVEPGQGTTTNHSENSNYRQRRTNVKIENSIEPVDSPLSPKIDMTNPWSRRNTSLDLEDYFEGPRDMSRHSKWPIPLRMHGSILPKMIVPLLFVAAWSSWITCLHMLVDSVDLSVSNILLTITGFIVGLGLSFRSSTAYERYAEGRRFWTSLMLYANNIGRGIWVHCKEREEPELRKHDVLCKLTAMNLLVAFGVSLKHKLRWEPYTDYHDLAGLVGHLETFAKEATMDDAGHPRPTKPGFFKATGQYLGISFAASNPRKLLKRATKPVGNLPLEILTYIASYTDEIVDNGQLPIGMTQTLMYNSIAGLNDVLTGCERVATTPLPIAYQIAFHQITWVYVLLLPFQLLETLEWITIPAAMAASYIILGILFIGNEIEDPFGQDVNDLPLDEYCAQIALEMDIIASRKKPHTREWVTDPRNKPLFPMSNSPYGAWMTRSEDHLRTAVRTKADMGFEERRHRSSEEKNSSITTSREKSPDTLVGDSRV